MPETLPATERKLRETEFFLNHMLTANGQTVRPEPEALGFYLSAFLGAASSVTWALQKEVGGGEAYKKWFERWLAGRSEADTGLLRFMKDQRNFEVKEDGAETTETIEMVPISSLPIPDRSHPAYQWTYTWPPDTPPPTVGRFVSYFDGDESVADRCRRYLDLLRELVRDYRAAHGLS